jgi:hypothetical protein
MQPGGSVIDLAEALYGITAGGRGYHEIRKRIAAALGLREPT